MVVIRALVLVVPLALGGCLSTPDLQALAADPAAVCIRVTTIYGTIETSRNHGCEPASSIPKP